MSRHNLKNSSGCIDLVNGVVSREVACKLADGADVAGRDPILAESITGRFPRVTIMHLVGR